MIMERLYLRILPLLFALFFATSITAHAEETENMSVPMEDVQRFSNAIGQIKKYYVNPIDDKQLFDNAIRGMLNGLDPHSTYLDENELQQLQTITNGEFGGLGIEVMMEEGVVKVVTPLVDTPAFKAGIKAGDYIIKLGEQPVQGISLKEAVEKMRGKIGTTIPLTVLRPGTNKPLVFQVKRESIQIKSVLSRLLDNNYGYVRLTQFQALTADDMKKAVFSLKKQSQDKLNGLILDLRNNPGGLLDSAIQVSDAFIDNNNHKKEMIVYTQGRLPGSKFIALANPGDILNNAPMVVLINNGSASGAEIVAGALKDNKRALVLGTQSFGKGSVQTVLPIDEKRAIKLTTALYYTPSGISIQAKGITPDIIIEEAEITKHNQPPLFSYNEASLKGHLLNKTEAEKQKKQEEKLQSDQALILQDYQLYAALTILKGLVFAKR